MFTGIIEAVGTIANIDVHDENRRIQISTHHAATGLKLGDSISVSGVCLTALDITKDSFQADLAPETWQRTSFSRLKTGALVNLELPMRASGRFDGHIVQGHVDGIGKLQRFEQIPGTDNWWLTIQLPAELEKYVVNKGSIAIEGISLTVASMKDRDCTVAIIPHTVESTNLKSLRPGDPVNLEVDVVAKYVEKMMRNSASTALKVEQLVERGF